MNNPAKYIAIILTILVCRHDLVGQEKAYRYEASGAYHLGFIIAHRNNIRPLLTGYTKAIELTWSRRHNGQNDWEQKYAYPYSGVSFYAIDFSNPEMLGRGYGLLAFYDFPLNHSPKLQISFKIGFGPGYIEKRFDAQNNFRNYGISTHLNGFAHGNFRLKYHLKDHLQANLGLGIFHFSNASFRKPNLGINIPIVNVGVGYGFHPEERVPRKEKSAYSDYKKWYHDFVFAYGTKEKNPIGGLNHNIFTLHYDGGYQVTFKSRFGGGADFFYNTSLSGEKNNVGDTILTPGQIAQAGLHVSYSVQVARFSIYLHTGRYIYTPYRSDGWLYNRAGIRYAFNDHILFNLSMKTHLAIADHVEYGIGYRF